MKMHNLHGTRKVASESESSESEEEEEEDKKPQLELAMVPHYGGINRVRVLLTPYPTCALPLAVPATVNSFILGR